MRHSLPGSALSFRMDRATDPPLQHNNEASPWVGDNLPIEFIGINSGLSLRKMKQKTHSHEWLCHGNDRSLKSPHSPSERLRRPPSNQTTIDRILHKPF